MPNKEFRMTSNITIRDMLPEELDRVAALHDQIHALHVNGRPDIFVPACEDSTGLMNWHAQQPNRRVLVAVREGTVLGYAVVACISRPGGPYTLPRRFLHVEEICVDEAHRHCGAGKALMEFIYQAARENGYPRVELDVWAFNNDAQAFYQAMGMKTYRHFLEMQVLPYRFMQLTPAHGDAAMQLYESLKGTPGCTWDEGYPDRAMIDADIAAGRLYGVFDDSGLIAAGAAMPDEELNGLECWQVPSEKPCMLTRIGVKANRQGQGIAKQLVHYLEDEMRMQGHDAARMLVSPGNEKALRAYRSCAYQQAGSARMFEEDWFCFEKRLSQGIC